MVVLLYSTGVHSTESKAAKTANKLVFVSMMGLLFLMTLTVTLFMNMVDLIKLRRNVMLPK